MSIARRQSRSLSTPGRTPGGRRRPARRFWTTLESLEGRVTPATFTETGAVLALDLNVANEAVSIVAEGTDYALTLSGGNTWSGTDSVNVSGNGSATLTVTSAGLTAFTTVNLTDSNTGTSVAFADSGANAYAAAFGVTLDSSPGAVTFDGNSLFGPNSLTVTTTRNVIVNAGAVVSTGDGNLSISANQQATPTAGNFVGVDVAGQVVSTGLGTLTVKGLGGTDSGGSQMGVRVRDGGKVLGGSGNVVVTGGGGSSFGKFNHGVLVSDAGSVIASGGGTLTVTGVGGILQPGTSDNHGVFVSGGGLITSFGAGNVSVTGSCSVNSIGDTLRNYGVFVTGSASMISSGGGDVGVKGTGGGGSTGGANLIGVYLTSGGQILSGGNGNVTVTGVGNPSIGNTNSCRGVALEGSSRITSGGSGTVSVTGDGGLNGYGNFGSYGVYVAGGSRISSGGAGAVNVVGRAGPATRNTASGSHGVYLTESASTITSGGGGVDVTGTGATGPSGSFNCHGVFVDALAQVSSGGGDVRVKGTFATSGATSSAIYGVYLNGGGRISSGGSGSVTVTGDNNGGLNDPSGRGVIVAGGSQISSGGLGSVTVKGSLSLGGSGGCGVTLEGAASSITSGGGDVSVTGTTGARNGAYGVLVDVSAFVSSGGAGAVTVNGKSQGIVPGSSNHGVRVLGRIDSGGGNVLVSGTGGAYSSGVEVVGQITAGGLGQVTVTGLGGQPIGSGSDPVNGVQVAFAGVIQSSGGNVFVDGTGGQASSVACYGVFVAGRITAGGDGTVTVKGASAGPAFASDKIGVFVSGGLITSNGAGPVTVTGTPGTNSATTRNSGVVLSGAGRILSGGPGTVTVTGTGGTGFSDNTGVIVTGTGSQISSGGGNVVVNGYAGNGGSKADGVRVDSGGRITSGGAGTVSVAGTGGALVAAVFTDASGVRVTDAGSSITAGGAGLLTVYGTINPAATAGNAGLAVKSSAQVAGGAGGDVVVTSDSLVVDATSVLTAGGTNSVTLQNDTAGLPIELGSAGVFGSNPALKLPDAVLERVTAGRLVVGRNDANATGRLVISSDLTRATSTDLTLVSNPGISTTTAGPLVDLSGGKLTFGNESALAVNITSPVLNTGYTQLLVSGTVDLTGLNLLLGGSYFPVNTTTFTLVNATSLLGTFNGLPDGASTVFTGRTFVAGYDATTMTLTFTNHPPVAVNDTAATTDQAAVVISPLVNDSDPDLGDSISIVAVSTPSVGSVQFTANSITYTPVVNFSGPVTFSYTISDLGGLTATATVTVTVTDVTPPKVVDLRVLYGSQSYSILNLTRTLPWFNIKTIQVDFSEPVVLASSAVSLTGKTVPNYNPSLSVASNRAVLSLPTAIDIDRLLLTLDGTSPGGVHDLSGNAMGSNFTKAFNVLPGDYNGDGVVTTTDLIGLGNVIGAPPTGSSVFGDLDGDGQITLADYNLVKQRLGRRLPTP